MSKGECKYGRIVPILTRRTVTLTLVLDFDGTIALGAGPLEAFARAVATSVEDPTFADRAMADLAAWAKKMDSPPPAEFLGGVSPIAPGGRNDLSLSLPPGHYAMLCFLPDAKDHAPHIAHGMVHEFTIR